jgi:peptidoglycan hydrolase-like protein with peptidoglycan-binding domain
MTRYGVAMLPMLALLAGCNTFSGMGKDLGTAKEAIVGKPAQPAQTAQGPATTRTPSPPQTSTGSQQNSANTSGYWKNDTSSYRGETNTAAGARARRDASSASARSDDVKQVQTALKTQGLYDGPIDGIYGPGTRNAVKKYQSQAGITQTGQLDQQTMQGLNRSGSGSGGTTTQ